ncbi:MAG: hypothetical protein GXP08_14000 [Gammaproteobacteria bacterium]|nr:hypothetical protein [Gammaproteobacteria bacterium]
MTFSTSTAVATTALLPTICNASGEWSGNVAVEVRSFAHTPSFSDQHDDYLSISAQPEYFFEWDNGKQSFLFIPFVRIDQHDKERTHADIRELAWIKASDVWELRAGIRKVFWGVTESQHLVDIINQTDAIENIDRENKLGQTMINLALIQDWGTLDFFVLPGFRERTFAGREGRLRTQPPVDTDNTVYEASNKNKHTDLAIRWSHFIGDWDVGISHFYGTSRDPRFTINTDRSAIIPNYDIINQTGLSLQTVVNDWLWKLEMISRNGHENHYTALTGGFEYTLVGIINTQADLGIISEYLYDNRDEAATTPFQNDIMLGARFTLNDVQSTEILAGLIFDIDNNGHLFNLEASRRLGDAWKLNLEIRTFSNINSLNDPLYSSRNDDHLQIELAWYF